MVNGTYETPTPSDEQQWLDKTAGARAGTQAILDSLRDANPVLRGILQDTLAELASAGPRRAARAGGDEHGPRDRRAYSEGRRLLQREASLHVEDLLVTHPVMATSGMAGIPGITSGACEALCEALRMKEVTSADSEECKAFAFKRSHPFDAIDRTGRCYLLREAGACKTEDFGTHLFTRHVQSESFCTAATPGARRCASASR